MTDENEISVSINIDARTRQLLTESAKASERSLKTEATIRVNDHISHFIDADRIPYSYTDNTKATIIALDVDVNDILNEHLKKLAHNAPFKTKKLNKSKECGWRLRDHLNKFESIATVGRRFNRN